MPLAEPRGAGRLPLRQLTTCCSRTYFDKDKFYNLILKFDWNFGSKHRAFFRHASNDRTEDRAVNGIDNKPGTDGQQPFQRINDAYVADWVSTFARLSSSTCADPTTGSSRRASARPTRASISAAFGIPKSLISQLPNPDKSTSAAGTSIGTRTTSHTRSDAARATITPTRMS